MKTSRHVETAAEAITAAHFARLGWDVTVQYGPNQPEFDLVAISGDLLLKVSVKGSNEGCWGLTMKYLEKQAAQDQYGNERKKLRPDYHKAADKWLEAHGKKTVLALVQFQGVPHDQLPRIYLATPREIAQRLKETANGRGDTILHESHMWGKTALAYGTTEAIPEHWRFTEERLIEVARRFTEPTCQ